MRAGNPAAIRIRRCGSTGQPGTGHRRKPDTGHAGRHPLRTHAAAPEVPARPDRLRRSQANRPCRRASGRLRADSGQTADSTASRGRHRQTEYPPPLHTVWHKHLAAAFRIAPGAAGRVVPCPQAPQPAAPDTRPVSNRLPMADLPMAALSAADRPCQRAGAPAAKPPAAALSAPGSPARPCPASPQHARACPPTETPDRGPAVAASRKAPAPPARRGTGRQGAASGKYDHIVFAGRCI